MKRSSMTCWLALALGLIGPLLTSTSALAETYHLLNVRDLDFEKEQKTLKSSLDHEVRVEAGWRSEIPPLALVSVRFPGEAHIAAIPVGEKQWSIKQGSLQVAFCVEGDAVQKAFIDLWDGENSKELTSFSFNIDPKKAPKCTKQQFIELRQRHYEKLSHSHLPGTAWFRVQAGPMLKRDNQIDRWNRPDLGDTFSIFTGGRALSENLALDRDLILGIDPKEKKKKPDADISTITGITVKAIDWKSRLPEGEVEVDPLSLAIPADQHALFAPSLKGLFDLMDLVEREGAPVIQTFTVRNPFRSLPSKYRAQMGLDVPDMIARMLPVKSTAVTGSDPFFPTGTDVAVLFETEQAELLYQTLTKTISLKANRHKAKLTKMEGDGFSHLGFETADRAFSSHVIRHGKLVAVTNSRAQAKRLIAVQEKKAEALGASEEYRFFRHRYPMNTPDQATLAESAFVFISDATLRRWGGPRLRIGASRRARAAAALSQLNAKSIAGMDVGQNFADLLSKVTVTDQQVASEIYGSLNFITPAAELPITTVTSAEKSAYIQWRAGYEGGWAKVFDPIAIRLALSDKKRELDMTILPLRVDSDYNEMLTMVGKSTLSQKGRAIPAEALFYGALAVDSNSEAFKEFDQELLEMLPGLKINPLSWVGQSVSVHLEDGFFWKAMAHTRNSSDMNGT